MIVTAWNNGEYHPSGAGYGLKIDASDRDRYFSREWGIAILQLQGKPQKIKVNIDKDSFWGEVCRELINKEIGLWLIKNNKTRWEKGNPPKLEMQYIEENQFRVKLID